MVRRNTNGTAGYVRSPVGPRGKTFGKARKVASFQCSANKVQVSSVQFSAGRLRARLQKDDEYPNPNDPPSRGRHGETGERMPQIQMTNGASERASAAGSSGVAAAGPCEPKGAKTGDEDDMEKGKICEPRHGRVAEICLSKNGALVLSKAAVSPNPNRLADKCSSARCCPSLRKFGNLRYSRLGRLRYVHIIRARRFGQHALTPAATSTMEGGPPRYLGSYGTKGVEAWAQKCRYKAHEVTPCNA